MNTDTKTRKIAYVAGACAAALFIVYGFLIFLVIHNVDKAVFVLGEIAEETNKEANLRLLKNSINNTERDRAKIATRFVSEEGVVSFIEQVESLGALSRAQVTLSSVSIDEGILKLEISAVGSFSEVFHFLTLAENLPFKVAFEKVSILKLPENKEGDEWKTLATFNLLSFNVNADASNKKIK